MYKSRFDTELRDETNFVKRNILWIALAAFVLGFAGWCAATARRSADKVVGDPIASYEDFQEIWNSCQKLNTDLGTLRAIDERDRMFDQFSKSSLVAAKKQKLAGLVEEYNGKSKMWNRAVWKSKSLPYQLDVNDFPNYAEPVAGEKR